MDELLVDEGHLDAALGRLNRLGVRARSRPLRSGGVALVHMEPSARRPSVPELIEDLRRSEPGTRVAPNRLLRPASHMHVVGTRSPEPAGPLTALPTGDDLAGHGVTVGVVDSGFCPDPWFGNRVEFRERDIEGPPASTAQSLPFATGHGTFVAGVILQHAPGVRIVARRVIGDDGHVTDSVLADVLAEMEHVDIINLSLGSSAEDEDDAVGLLGTANSLFKLWQKKPRLVVVAPAGNDGGSTDFWPGTFEPVVAVAALNAEGTAKADFTNFAEWVDASAKGEAVHSRFMNWEGQVQEPPVDPDGQGTAVDKGPFSGWATWDGTSFATPRVTGAIAATVDRARRVDGAAAVQRVLQGPPAFEGGGTKVDPRSFVSPA